MRKDLRETRRAQWLIGLLGLIALLCACSDDSSDQSGKQTLLELVPYYNIYKVWEEEQGTRGERDTDLFGKADGDGPYVPYANLSPQADPAYSTIHVYLTTTTATPNKIETEGNFTFRTATYYTQEECDAYNTQNSLSPGDDGYWTTETVKTDARWTSGVWLDKTIPQYYVYGFMPASIARNAVLYPNEGFENKAILKLKDIDAITPADICVIVGVKGTNTRFDIAESAIKIGEFGYQTYIPTSENDPKGNYIYLLLDHLYSCLNLEYRLGSRYSEMRSIRLRKVEMKVKGDNATKRDLTITINGDHYDVEETTIAASSNAAVVFDKTRATLGELIPTKIDNTSKGLSVPGYFSPTLNDKIFVITSTYDVYDKKGNLIRANQTAENTITPEKLSAVSHVHTKGGVHTLQLLIEPTYLYQLSDGDLDNPTIKVIDN